MKRVTKKLVPLLTLAVLAGTVLGTYHAVNSPAVQRHIFAALSRGNTAFEFTSDEGRIEFLPLSSRLNIKGLKIHGNKSQNTFIIDDASLRYSLFGLLQGELVIPRLSVNGFDAFIQSSEQPAKKIGIKKLLLLQNIEIKEGTIQNARLNFSDKAVLSTDTINIKFIPKITGRIQLEVGLQGMQLKTGDETISAAGFSIEGKTAVAKWLDFPPYVNSLEGSIRVQDLKAGQFSITRTSSKIAINDRKITLSDLELVKDQRPVKGGLEIDLANEGFKADIKIAEPFDVPTIGGETPTIDTAGEISGEVQLEGRGFSPGRSSGSAKIYLTHEKNGYPPLRLVSSPTWKNGVLDLGETSVLVGDGKIETTGKVNVPAKNVDIKFDGEGVPLDGVFGRFNDNNFLPIFGTAKATATMTGWGKNFHVQGDAETTAIGGYYKIKTDRAVAHVDATYNELNLDGVIEQAGKKTGDISLKIKYGAKVKGHIRPKNLDIVANIYDNDLGKSFADYGLSGTGNGRLEIHGPQKAYRGKINAAIENGSFLGIVFQKVTSDAEMGYKKISYTNSEFVLPNLDPIVFTSALQMDFNEQGFRFHGNPLAELSVDVSHNSAGNSWVFKDARYKDIAISGTYSPTSANNLNVAGSFDLSLLSSLKEYFREVQGSASVKLHMSGASAMPILNGSISLDNDLVSLRDIGARMENVSGELKFNGRTVSTEGLSGTIEDGKFLLKGSVQLGTNEVERVDLALDGQNLRYSLQDRTFKGEFSTNLTWKGTKASSTLAGDISILDGRYTKDFALLGSLVSTQKKAEASAFKGDENTHLNLTIRNTGDLAIRNNVGDIWLNTDVTVTGTTAHPHITGAIEATEGKIHYLGREFTITRGYVEFRDPYTNPYLEISADHEVAAMPDTVVTAMLHGNIDNLKLDLSSTKAMEQKDIIAILMFGTSETATGDTQWSSGFGPQVLASQLTSMVERPITKLTHLDIFRLEAADPTKTGSAKTSDTLSPQISRIFLGKQLSDRLTMELNTDINVDDTQQMIRAEYLLTDFLLLIGEGTTGYKYSFDLSLRFRER